MINLKQISGLPISMQDDYKLEFLPPLKSVAYTTRSFLDMKVVLLDPSVKLHTEDTYYMYRGIHLDEDADKINAAKISYDITVIPPYMLGSEFNKTVGHYHPLKPGTKFAYPEIYQILNGTALILLQKVDQENNPYSVFTMEARQGEKIIYPPNYGHILINIGKDVLVTANWVSNDFKSLYEPVAKKHGMSHYVVKDGENYKLVPNPNYKTVPEVKMLTNKNMAIFPIMREESLYLGGVNRVADLEFLNFPERYAGELSTICS